MSSKKILKSLGRIAKLCRKTLVTLNTFGVTLAGLSAAAGLLLRFGQSFIGPHIMTLVKTISEMTNSAAFEIMDASQIDFGKVLAGTALFMMLLAVGTGLLAGIGLFGAKFNISFVTSMYCILMSLWVLIEVSGAIVVFAKRDLIDNAILPSFVNDIRNGYQGYNGTDTVSQTWNLIMIAFSCCGVNNYTDFKDCDKWNRKYYQEGGIFTLETPLLCCIFTGKAVDDFSCAVNPQPRTSNYRKGCYAEFWSLLNSYRMFIIIIIGIILMFQLILIGCSVFLTWSLRNVENNDSTSDGNSNSEGQTKRNRSPRNADSSGADLTNDTHSDQRRHHADRHAGPGLFDGHTGLFPGFQNRPCTPSPNGMMQNCSTSYLGQLVAAAFLQQHIAGFPESPFSLLNQEQRHRMSAPSVILRNANNRRERRQSNELALSLYTQPPSYDTAITPRIITIDDQSGDSDESVSWIPERSGRRRIRSENNEVFKRCRDCNRTADIENQCYSSSSRNVFRDDNRSSDSSEGQRSRSNTMTSDKSVNKICASTDATTTRFVKATKGVESPSPLSREKPGNGLRDMQKAGINRTNHSNTTDAHSSPKTEGRKDKSRQRKTMAQIFRNSKFSRSFGGFSNKT